MPASYSPTPWFWYIPSALLISVACLQLWLSHTADLSPWAGGGFGMFSSTDTRGNRHLHAFALRPGIRRELGLPRSLEPDLLHVLVFPTEANLRSFAAALSAVPTPDDGPLAAIELQIWATQFAPDNLQPASELLRAVTVQMSEPNLHETEQESHRIGDLRSVLSVGTGDPRPASQIPPRYARPPLPKGAFGSPPLSKEGQGGFRQQDQGCMVCTPLT